MPSRRIPSLNWLRVFDVAARMENFTRAAEVLNMSAAAVSQQILALETHLGEALFERRPQRVVLTEKGRAFMLVVQQSLAAVDTTAGALFGSHDRQIVNLQAVTILAMGWLPEKLKEFEASNPGIRVNLTTGNTIPDFRTASSGGQPDLQIAFGSAIDFPDTAIRFLDETLSVVGHADLVSSISSLEDIRTMRLIEVAPHRSGWHQVLANIEGIDIGDMDLSFVDTTPLALMLAHAGFGLALAREPACQDMAEALNLQPVPLLPPVKGQQSYFILWPDSRPLSRAARLLVDWLTAG
ncbi:LysR family transcriptional regulator [Nisaea sp.]|uniref:LysR family transcriptional regulator n=1 Tax=Nisaea sp. TaxID=2024842 RepID=UPI0032EC9055